MFSLALFDFKSSNGLSEVNNGDCNATQYRGKFLHLFNISPLIWASYELEAVYTCKTKYMSL